MLSFLLNLSITPLPAEEWNKFMLSFLLNLSITPLPAEELNESLCCVSCLIMSVTCSPALPKKIYVNFISEVVSCVSSRFPKIGVKFRTKFVIRVLL